MENQKRRSKEDRSYSLLSHWDMEKHREFHIKSKSIAELGQADQKNEWFEKGMEAVSLAPTAVNQQKFYFELKNGIVTAKNLGGFYSRIDLGIVKYHFEVVTGHEVK